MANVIEILIKANNKASAELAKVDKSLGSIGKGAGIASGGIADMAKSFLPFAGAASLVFAVGKALNFALGEASKAEQIMAQTESTIRATGGTAGFTADEIANLSGELSLLTSIEDETVQSGLNMLMTFREIGEDVFPRAAQTMADMATAMAGGDVSMIDLKGTAIQLGKALNDPILGLTALRRVGVAFTEEQKNTIEAMVKAGNVTGAQTVILEELEAEFGKAAIAAGDTFAGSVNKVKNALGNMGEAVGTGALEPLKIFNLGIADSINMLNELITRYAILHPEFTKQARDLTGSSRMLNLNTDAVERNWEEYYKRLGVLSPTEQAEQAQKDALIEINQALADTEVSIRGNSGAWLENLSLLNESDVALDELGETTNNVADKQKHLADVTSEAAKRAEEYKDHIRDLNREQDGLLASLKEIAQQNIADFFAVDIDPAGIAKQLFDVVAFKEAGGEAMNTLIGQVQAAVVEGKITPEQAKEFFKNIAIEGQALEVQLGKISLADAAESISEDFNIPIGDAKVLIEDVLAGIDLVNNADLSVITEQFDALEARKALLIEAGEIPIEADPGDKAEDKLDTLKTKLDKLTQDPHTIDVILNILGGGKQPGPPPRPGNPNGPGGQHGLDIIVPMGFPGDTYPLRASSGERVTIAPAGATNNIGGDTINIYNNNAAAAVLTKAMVADRKRARLNASMGR